MVGFDNIEIRDVYDRQGRLVIPDHALVRMHRVLTNSSVRARMVEHNFRLGKKEFGMGKLREMLADIFDEYGDEIRASRRRIEKSTRRYPV